MGTDGQREGCNLSTPLSPSSWDTPQSLSGSEADAPTQSLLFLSFPPSPAVTPNEGRSERVNASSSVSLPPCAAEAICLGILAPWACG